ncbi:MAG: TusE/DsrC/DsvC family sulfur relay protein [Gallionella sp.]|nr:TusE/DsrC/DsvC family sulfur relay protein [Gallionella sp.]MDD4958268.1 TusE/DsrC/DsvC family sulfur relay protein [Gallionella sp.]
MESALPLLPDRDEEGYLIDPAQWNETVALTLAQEAELTLSEAHWQAIHFMRNYYAEHQVIPDVRHVIKHLAEEHGSKDRNLIFTLFPYGYVAQACKIAGMKRPRGWSTG